MNPLHLHLLINHIPVLGAFFGCLLMGISLVNGREETRKNAFAFFVFLAILTPFVFLSGEFSEDLAKKLPGVEESRIETHAEAADMALIGIELLGVIAGGTWFLNFFPNSVGLRKKMGWVLFIVAIVVSGWLSWTATTGGRIRHGEEFGKDIKTTFFMDMDMELYMERHMELNTTLG